MRIRLWPRTIRFQLLGGLILLELLSVVLFGTLIMRQQTRETYKRTRERLEHQATSVAVQTVEALRSRRPDVIGVSVSMMGKSPSVNTVMVTDAQGKILFESDDNAQQALLDPTEMSQIYQGAVPDAKTFLSGNKIWEAVAPIRFQNQLFGYAWVRTEQGWDQETLTSLRQSATLFGVVWISASIVLAWIMARSIASPLAVLHRGTRALMMSPENHAQFPLPVIVHNEIGELIEAFNRMVASVEEQRSGLRDTLSLLDSMLANAPIGLAFFDRQCHLVRVNRIFAELTGTSPSLHVGRSIHEVLPPAVALQLEQTIQAVIDSDEPVRDVEVSGSMEELDRRSSQTEQPLQPAQPDQSSQPVEWPSWTQWSWITSAYPIRTGSGQAGSHGGGSNVRWVGLIVLDASDRKRSEDALRKTEKLAATGRLAASIAHEINNPLEAITNLLYLLSHHSSLEEPARSYAVMAEHEVRRISEITQQTLRFYRQSTRPARANLADLLDSVLSLHQGRLRNRGIIVERKYDPAIDLYCFAGELRQVFANLIGNAIDAMPFGGKLILRARRSTDAADSSRRGVRFQVADTGSGMTPGIQKLIFEPFFTTKDATGTGLGLWVSSGIVGKHFGSIRVRSRVATDRRRAGTVFELFFPDGEGDISLSSESHAGASAVPASGSLRMQ